MSNDQQQTDPQNTPVGAEIYLHFMPEKLQHGKIIFQACDSPLRKCPPPSAWIFH